MPTDDQTEAEALDEDELGGEPMPPDEPLGVDEYGTTIAEERYPEPLDEFIRREEPEGAEAVGDRDADPIESDGGPLDPPATLPEEQPAEKAAMHIEPEPEDLP